MGGFGVPGCAKSSRKPEYSPILTPGGRSERCQRHRGLKDQPAAEADTFGSGMHHWGPPPHPHRDAVHARQYVGVNWVLRGLGEDGWARACWP